MNVILWSVLAFVVAPIAFVALATVLRASVRAVDVRQLAREDGEQMRALRTRSGPSGHLPRHGYMTSH